MKPEKVLYTAHASATGGRENSKFAMKETLRKIEISF